MRKFSQQLIRGLSFQPLQQPTDGDLRGNRHEQMYVILAHMPLHNRDFVLPTDFPDHIPHAQGHFAGQGRPTIFSDPDQMEVNLKNCVRPVSIFLHSSILRERGTLAKAVA